MCAPSESDARRFYWFVLREQNNRVGERLSVCATRDRWDHSTENNAPWVNLCVLEEPLLQRHRQTKAWDGKGCVWAAVVCFVVSLRLPCTEMPRVFEFFSLFLSKPSGSFFTHFKWTFYLTQRRADGKKKNTSRGIQASLNGTWWVLTTFAKGCWSVQCQPADYGAAAFYLNFTAYMGCGQ